MCVNSPGKIAKPRCEYTYSTWAHNAYTRARACIQLQWHVIQQKRRPRWCRWASMMVGMMMMLMICSWSAYVYSSLRLCLLVNSLLFIYQLCSVFVEWNAKFFVCCFQLVSSSMRWNLDLFDHIRCFCVSANYRTDDSADKTRNIRKIWLKTIWPAIINCFFFVFLFLILISTLSSHSLCILPFYARFNNNNNQDTQHTYTLSCNDFINIIASTQLSIVFLSILFGLLECFYS